MKKFTLDWNVMKTWPPVLWGIFFGLIGLIAFILYVVVKMYVEVGILRYYIALLATFFTWFIHKAKQYKDTHIHHYCLGSFVVAICCHQDWFITAVSGVFCGVLIEGSSKWGLDPVFSDKISSRTENAMKLLNQSKIRQENYQLKQLSKNYVQRDRSF
jgi:hypothetical protein